MMTHISSCSFSLVFSQNHEEKPIFQMVWRGKKGFLQPCLLLLQPEGLILTREQKRRIPIGSYRG